MNKDQETIERIRDFNRYYVRTIGLLNTHILDTSYSLTEAHVLNLINSNPGTTATAINKELHLNEGYLSRVIKKLLKQSLLTKKRSEADSRVFVLNLTEKGKKEYQKLDLLSSDLIESKIRGLSQENKSELADIMDRAKFLLSSSNS